MPYQLQYPSDHSKEYSEVLTAKLLALFRYRQSYHENLLYFYRYPTKARYQLCPYEPRYNAKQLAHRHPSNQSYPDLPPRYNASSKIAPSLPLHHKSTNRRVDDIYPSLHQQYARILQLHVALSNHFSPLHREYGGLLASNHHAHPAKRGQSAPTSNSARRNSPSRLQPSILLRHLLHVRLLARPLQQFLRFR